MTDSLWSSGPPPDDVAAVLTAAVRAMQLRDGMPDVADQLGDTSVESAQAEVLDIASEVIVDRFEPRAIRTAQQWALAAADLRPGEVNQLCAVMNRAVERLGTDGR